MKGKSSTLTRLKPPKFDITEADEIYEDEDERYEVKQLIKSYQIPESQSLNTYQYKMFGMS